MQTKERYLGIIETQCRNCRADGRKAGCTIKTYLLQRMEPDLVKAENVYISAGTCCRGYTPRKAEDGKDI